MSHQANFASVSALVHESLTRNGIDVEPTKATLAMMNRVGTLAAFCGFKFAGREQQQQQQQRSAAGGAALNVEEMRELRQILGDLGVALFALASATNVDLGECVMQSLGAPVSAGGAQQQQQQQQPSQQRSPPNSLPPVWQQQQQQQQFAPPTTVQQPQQQQQQQQQQQSCSASPWRPRDHDEQPGQHQDCSLNPNSSIENIKSFITSIRGQSVPVTDAEFAEIGLTFAFRAPNSSNNQVVELINNGANTPVRSHNFQRFCDLFFDHTARWENSSSPSGSPASGQQQQQQQSGSRSASLGANRPAALQPADLDDTSNAAAAAAFGGLNSPGLGPSRPPQSSSSSQSRASPARNNRQQQQPEQQRETDSDGEIVGRENGAVIKRLKVDETGHPNLAAEQALYSPSHEQLGLFSPVAKGSEIDVVYPDESPVDGAANKAASPHADPSQQLFRNQHIANNNNEAGEEQQQQQQEQEGSARNARPPAPNPDIFQPIDPEAVASSAALFDPRFTHLERIIIDVEDQLAGQGKTASQIRQLLPVNLDKSEVESLNLVFAIPFKERAFELTEGGLFMHVVVTNAREFVQLVRDQRAIFDGRLNKKPSIKMMAVRQPVDSGREVGGFASHSTDRPDMAAPAEARTTFSVDLDDAATLVPKALQKERLPILIPSAAHYVNFISQHPEQWPEMFAAVRRNPSLLARWNVTWCVVDPSAPVPHSIANSEHQARRCGIRELLQGGASTTVRETEIETFVEMVLAVAKELPHCLQPASGNNNTNNGNH